LAAGCYTKKCSDCPKKMVFPDSWGAGTSPGSPAASRFVRLWDFEFKVDVW